MIRVFISYAWDNTTRVNNYVCDIKRDLENLNILTYLDMSNNKELGSSIRSYIDNIKVVDYIIIVCTNEYFRKIYDDKTVLYEEWKLILNRLNDMNVVLPIVYENECTNKIPPELKDIVRYDSTDSIDKLVKSRINKDICNHNFSPNDEHLFENSAYNIAKELFPNYVWKIKDTNNIISYLSNNSAVNIIKPKEEIYTSHKLDIETVFLEGFFQCELKTVLVFSNSYIQNSFKYMANKQYQKVHKNIHFFDKEIIEKIKDYSVFLESTPSTYKLDDAYYLYNVVSLYFVDNKDYYSMQTQAIYNSDIYSFDFNINESFGLFSELYDAVEYKLYIRILAKKDGFIKIIIDKNQPFKTLDNNSINISKGINELLVPIQITKNGRFFDSYIEILFNEGKLTKKLSSFSVSPLKTPKIYFKAQQQILTSLEIWIRENINSDSNIFLSIFANAGNGKTYLCKSFANLMTEHYSDSHDCIYYCFTGNEYEDRTIIANILFYTLLSIPFDYSNDWLNTEQISKNVLRCHIKKTLAALKDLNCDYAEIMALLVKTDNKGGLCSDNRFYRKKKMIIIDDIQKLSLNNSNLFTVINKQTLSTNNNLLFVVAAREKELRPNMLDYIKRVSNPYQLKEMTSQDIKASIMLSSPNLTEFLERRSLSNYFDNLKVFYAIRLIEKMINHTYKDLHDFNDRINTISYNISAPNYLKNIFSKLPSNEYNLLNEIYLQNRVGLTVNISDYIDLKNIIDKFIILDIIQIINGCIKSTHDLYLESFNYYYDGNIAETLISKLINTKSFENQLLILAEIVKCESVDSSKYKKQAYELLKQEYAKTNFYRCLILAEGLMYKLDKTVFSDTDIVNIKFYYAVSLNHCGNIEMARLVFSEISNYKHTNDSKHMGIVLESKTEKINIDYWQLETDNILTEIEEVKLRCEIFLYSKNYNIINAYLNAYNRNMVTCLLLDEFDEAGLLFDKNIELATELNRRDYIGYAYMDYAKGLYNINIEESLEYLEKAYDIFTELLLDRRMHDCKCEIEFLKSILNHNNLVNLIESSKVLETKGYINIYVKSLIKITALELIKNNKVISILDDFLGDITLYSPAFDNRVQLLVFNMDIIKNKMLNQPLYNEKTESLMNILKRIGDSYSGPVNNNLNQTKSNSKIDWIFNFDRDEDSFYLDSRIW